MSDDYSDICPQCHYPMLTLRGFEGVSSYDARHLLGRDAGDLDMTGALKSAYSVLLGSGWRAFRRRRKVRRLRAHLLTDFPFTIICPQCLHVVRRR